MWCASITEWFFHAIQILSTSTSFPYKSTIYLINSSVNPFFKFFFSCATVASVPGPLYCQKFTLKLRHMTLGRTPLEEWSARRRDFQLTKHNTQNRKTSIPPAGIRTRNRSSKRPQTHDLDGAGTGTGIYLLRMPCDICKKINISGYTYSGNTHDYNFLLMRVSTYWQNCLDTFLTHWRRAT
jgi:hypothetical protein